MAKRFTYARQECKECGKYPNPCYKSRANCMKRHKTISFSKKSFFYLENTIMKACFFAVCALVALLVVSVKESSAQGLHGLRPVSPLPVLKSVESESNESPRPPKSHPLKGSRRGKLLKHLLKNEPFLFITFI